MSRYVILVEFETKPGCFDRFMELIRQNAFASLRDEDGCERFDVLLPGQPNTVVLYEIYRDRAAFDAHCRAPHFLEFDTAVRDLVARKVVTELTTAAIDPAEAWAN